MSLDRLANILELLRKQEKELISEFLDDLQKYINYCNEWDYNIAKPLWEIREKWEQRKTK